MAQLEVNKFRTMAMLTADSYMRAVGGVHKRQQAQVCVVEMRHGGEPHLLQVSTAACHKLHGRV